MQRKCRIEKRPEARKQILRASQPRLKPSETLPRPCGKTFPISLNQKYDSTNTWETTKTWQKFIGMTRKKYHMITENMAPSLWICYRNLSQCELATWVRMRQLNIILSNRLMIRDESIQRHFELDPKCMSSKRMKSKRSSRSKSSTSWDRVGIAYCFRTEKGRPDPILSWLQRTLRSTQARFISDSAYGRLHGLGRCDDFSALELNNSYW